MFLSLSEVNKDALSIILNKLLYEILTLIENSVGMMSEDTGYVPLINLDKNNIFLYLNKILLLNICN